MHDESFYVSEKECTEAGGEYYWSATCDERREWGNYDYDGAIDFDKCFDNDGHLFLVCECVCARVRARV